MKITRIESHIVRLPADEPLANGPAVPGATRNFVTLTLFTDAGIEGIGITGFGGALTGALKVAVDALAALSIGMDPLRIEAIADELCLTLLRTSRSVFVNEAADFAVGMLDAQVLEIVGCKVDDDERAAGPQEKGGTGDERANVAKPVFPAKQRDFGVVPQHFDVCGFVGVRNIRRIRNDDIDGAVKFRQRVRCVTNHQCHSLVSVSRDVALCPFSRGSRQFNGKHFGVGNLGCQCKREGSCSCPQINGTRPG